MLLKPAFRLPHQPLAVMGCLHDGYLSRGCAASLTRITLAVAYNSIFILPLSVVAGCGWRHMFHFGGAGLVIVLAFCIAVDAEDWMLLVRRMTRGIYLSGLTLVTSAVFHMYCWHSAAALLRGDLVALATSESPNYAQLTWDRRSSTISVRLLGWSFPGSLIQCRQLTAM